MTIKLNKPIHTVISYASLDDQTCWWVTNVESWVNSQVMEVE